MAGLAQTLLLASGLVLLMLAIHRLFSPRISVAEILQEVLRECPPPRVKTSDPNAPEASYIVTASEKFVCCTYPNRESKCLAWQDVRTIGVIKARSDAGFPSVFWALRTSSQELLIPWNATYETSLRNEFKRLPGFNWDPANEIDEMEDGTTLICWENEKAQGTKGPLGS